MRRLLPVLIVSVGLAACASPDPRLYTLLTTDPAGRSVALSTPTVFELRRVNIPGYLDRPEIVRRRADYRVHLLDNDRWSEPFGDLLQRTLTGDLTRRLPGGLAYSDDGAITAKPTQIVEVDISRLDADADGTVVLDADVAIRAPDDSVRPVTQTVHLTSPVAATGVAAYAAGASAATGQLADAIVAAARQLPATPAGS